MSRIPFLNPAVISKLPPIALKALRVVEGAITGLHQSPFKGQSIEFSEHKEYTPGDEIRHIDWKLFGKSDKYYVKQFEDETNLKSYLLVDASKSMAYPDHSSVDRISKFEYSATLALSIAYVMFRQQDAVGLFTFNEDLNYLFPPKNQPAYLLPMAKALATQEPTGKTSLAKSMRKVAEIVRRRKMLLLFSDLFDDEEDTRMILKQLAYQGHDLVVFHVMDPDELDFPFRERTLFEDMEAPEVNLQINAQTIRPFYLKEMNAFLELTKETAMQAGIEYWRVSTDTPMEEVLNRFLVQRHHFRRRRL